MGYESDCYRDEAGKSLADLGGDAGSKPNVPQKHVLDVASERSPTPVGLKCRKLVVKIKPGNESGPVDFKLGGNGVPGLVRDDYSGGKNKKMEKGENRKSLGKKKNVEKGEKEPRVKKSGKQKMRDHDEDSEINEMWDTIAGGNSEDDQEAVRTVDDDNFIDDSGVNLSDCYGSDNKHSPSQAPQAEEGEEDNEIEELFKIGKKKKKKESSPAEIALLVERVLAELHVAVEEDAELNRQEKPAITKLRNLSLLTDIIPRKHLQKDFLDRGVLVALREWLEPLPDGSIPSIDVRATVFKCLNDLTIDFEQSERIAQMKASGIGKAVMFYSKYGEETIANRKLAKELWDNWSRSIYRISTNHEDMKNYEEKRTYRRPPVKKTVSNAAAGASQDDVLDEELSQGQKYGPSSSKKHASRPEAMSMDFVVRPQSKVDPEAVRARAKQTGQGHRAKLNKKMQQLKATKRKQLQVAKPSPYM
ncbi:hypothetical protein C2S51_029933 [Perilla frutescens var. frutescens]|nr:hypothetical protein C2S51_029933 [Perilla frutescens var. frutescens]